MLHDEYVEKHAPELHRAKEAFIEKATECGFTAQQADFLYGLDFHIEMAEKIGKDRALER